jgi:two-component system response regulator AtoC
MKRALVVDDDSRVLAVISRLLSDAYNVVTCSDFKDARGVLQTLAPDVLVLDVRLGEFNGLQLGILAKQAHPGVHVVVMSSWDDPVLRREAMRLGATYVQKPFRAAELLEAVRGESTTPPARPA